MGNVLEENALKDRNRLISIVISFLEASSNRFTANCFDRLKNDFVITWIKLAFMPIEDLRAVAIKLEKLEDKIIEIEVKS